MSLIGACVVFRLCCMKEARVDLTGDDFYGGSWPAKAVGRANAIRHRSRVSNHTVPLLAG